MITNRRCILMLACKGPIVVPGKNVLNCVGIMNFFFFKKNSSSCAVNVKKCSLELGGKSPLVIFSDCDMDRAVRQVRILLALHVHVLLNICKDLL